jgi:hypothetical protein
VVNPRWPVGISEATSPTMLYHTLSGERGGKKREKKVKNMDLYQMNIEPNLVRFVKVKYQ